MMSDGDDDYGEKFRGRRRSHSASRRRPQVHHISGVMSSKNHELQPDSESEVESLLSQPDVERRGRPRGRSKRRRHRQCLSGGSSDCERAYGSEFETQFPPIRRNVRFTLSQGRTENWPGHTNISGGNQSSVGGSQKIIADHRYRRNDTRKHKHANVVNYGDNVHIHIHVDQGNAKIWVFSVGLFGRGDSMTMRCT